MNKIDNYSYNSPTYKVFNASSLLAIVYSFLNAQQIIQAGCVLKGWKNARLAALRFHQSYDSVSFSLLLNLTVVSLRGNSNHRCSPDQPFFLLDEANSSEDIQDPLKKSCRNVTDLRKVDLTCDQLRCLTVIAPHLTHLHLQDSSVHKKLSSISAFKSLTSLSIFRDDSFNRKSLRIVVTLPHLTSFRNRFCDSMQYDSTDLIALSQMTQLTVLEIECLDRLTNFSSLRKLRKMQHLLLDGVQRMSDIELIKMMKAMKGLKSLSLMCPAGRPGPTPLGMLGAFHHVKLTFFQYEFNKRYTFAKDSIEMLNSVLNLPTVQLPNFIEFGTPPFEIE